MESSTNPKRLAVDAIRAADAMVCGDIFSILPGARYKDWIVGDPVLASHDGDLGSTAQSDTHLRVLLTSPFPDLERTSPNLPSWRHP